MSNIEDNFPSAVQLEIDANDPEVVQMELDRLIEVAIQENHVAAQGIESYVNATDPLAGALILASIQFGSYAAYKIFDEIILPQLKARFGVKEKFPGNGSQAAEAPDVG